MSAKTKTVLFSVIAIALCAAVITVVLVLVLNRDEGVSHIRIEDGVSGGVQLVRGELDISLVRERLETKTLSNSGVYVFNYDNSATDFSKSNKNVFGIEGNLLITPGCYFSADMAIANKKNYAFEYWLEITPVNGESLLVEQLELTVIIDGETFIQRTLQDGLTTQVFPKVQAGQTAKFNVCLKYLDLKENDLTKNSALTFDMIVHARLTES